MTVTPQALSLLSGLLEQRTGQQLLPGRAWRIDTVLQSLMRERGIPSTDALVATLLKGPGDALADGVADALLNQETSFFRDAAVIDQIAEAVVAMQATASHRRARLWSAGCSTGQEPLSLAMLLAERFADPGDWPDIVATDVSPGAIARARAARYNQFEIQRGLPVRRMIRWFEEDGDGWKATARLVRRIAFRRHNLVADRPPAGQFDVILCRNVLMYFSESVRRSVFDRLASALRPGGLLVLGAGETVIGQTDRFEPSRRFRGFYDLCDDTAVPRFAVR